MGSAVSPVFEVAPPQQGNKFEVVPPKTDWLDKVKSFIGSLGPAEQSQESKAFFLGLAGEGAGMTSVPQTASRILSNLKNVVYTGKVAADGTPELTKLARTVIHPTELPENILRAAVPPPEEAVAAAKAQAGEANAAQLESQMKEVEAARQKELAQWERLKNQEAQALMNRGKQQTALDVAAAKNVPEPSPFAGATSSASPIGNLKLPEPGATATTTSGGLPEGTATPFVGKFTKPQASKIVSPLSPPPAVNRTLVSYDRDLLVHMARGGDLNALRELIRNPGGINVSEAVPNSRYLLGAP